MLKCVASIIIQFTTQYINTVEYIAITSHQREMKKKKKKQKKKKRNHLTFKPFD